jgi:methionyl-tRNA formyltransferase
MTTESAPPEASYALLASGANFSCEVLHALQQQHYLPRLLVLPEFPPAHRVSPANREIVSTTPQRRLIRQAPDIEIAYAAESRQAICASLIERYAIDFLLVACWPYLIGNKMIASARKAALNMHPSLLPDFRGPNPLAQQLVCRQPRFGVSLHLLNQQFDRGDIIAQAELEDPGEHPTHDSLEQRCAALGTDLFIAAVSQYEQGWKPIRQTG